jgi:hypothetical protein
MLLACFYRKVFAYSVSKGTDFSLEIKKEATDVTYEMLQRCVDRVFHRKLYDPSYLRIFTVVNGRTLLSRNTTLMLLVLHHLVVLFIL